MSFRFVTAGESHGPGLTAIVEGLPAGLELSPEGIDRDLARRQLGHGRGGRMKIEKDRAEVVAGVRHGRTLGSPVALRVENRDYLNWEERMNPWPVDAEVQEVHLPRPGHADLAGVLKFGHSDVRNVLERASARETAARVAAGRRGDVHPGDEGRGNRRRLRPGRPGRLPGTRRDLLVGGAGVLPRDQPRRRARGRHDQRRPARGAGCDEAAPDADEAAAERRPGDQGAGAGAARAHRLVHGAGGGRGGGGPGCARARRGPPGEARRRSHRRRARGARGVRGTDRVAESGVDAAIVLVGFMGAGKSTGARTLAAELGVDAVDSDREVERRLGEPIEVFFDREGEAAFRRLGEEVVGHLLERANGAVIALGGGAVQSERVREALTRHTVVHLEIETADAWRRASNKGRPLARDPDRFAQLHRDRRALYDAVADAVIPPADRDVLRRALPFLRALREAPPGTRLVWAVAESGSYPVFFGRGLIEAGFFPPLPGRRFVVTDENVARLQPVQGDERIVVMPGEERKTIHAAELVLRSLAQAGAERGDLVVAAGGGVVGDLAGFCAAVYQRGMRHVQVPTTLVAQVDSAYGGKTGVDLPEGKNYVGAFHQPAAVLCDPAVLDTLPPEEAAAGYVEVLKTALIAGGTGLLVALRLSGRDALRSEVADLLADRGLPLTYSGAAPDVVAAVAERDKKRVRGRVPFVLVEAPGKVTPGHDVDFASLYAAIEEVHSQ